MAIISVDPSKRKTGGALLGDRIRMNAINPEASSGRVYMRSLATRQSNLALSRYVQDAVNVCKAAHFDLIVVETSGIGQSDTEITEHSDVSLYVMTAEYGGGYAAGKKFDMLDFADIIAINKFDKRGSLDALRDVRKQYRRNHNDWTTPDDELPILGTIASQFNDAGMNRLFRRLMQLLVTKVGADFTVPNTNDVADTEGSLAVIPPDRVRYLAEIVEESRRYDALVNDQSVLARQLYQIDGVIKRWRHPNRHHYATNFRLFMNNSKRGYCPIAGT